MSEFRFSCPECRRDILCDDSYAGTQINCPVCQKPIIVPSPQAKAGGGGGGSGVMRTVLIVAAIVVVLAALGVGGWHFYSKHKVKANPAAQVAVPSADATIQALSILTKVHSAYTNTTSETADGTVTLFLDLSNLTFADLNPGAPANAANPKRRPQGMPRIVTNATDFSIKRAQSNWFYFAGEAVSKIDRLPLTNTFAIWSAGKGTFMFTDSHQRMAPASYMQIADAGSANNASAQATEQVRNLQQLFGDPAQLTKIIKDLGQTDDESVNGQDCCTLTAKVLGQKVKIWVDKSTYMILQSQITLGGAISDADVDDAFSLVAVGFTNLPPPQLEMIKAQVKKYTPAMTKIRGTITSTTRNLVVNPTISADDFNYPVPQGVRLIPMRTPPGSAAPVSAQSTEANWRNACINNLRQIDAAKNEWALEKNKAKGTAVTEADIKPYLKPDASGNLPKCPAGGKYTIGNVGELPVCSIPGHVLP